MKKIISVLFTAFLIAGCADNQPPCEPQPRNPALASIDSMSAKLNWPADLNIMGFSGPDLTPSPACLAVAASGEVYVGVDMIGSLGKKPGQGRIVKLVDCNNDGIIDRHTEYAVVDDPRGIISIGDKLYVLHTVFTDTTATGMALDVYEDKNNDGLADGKPKRIVDHMSNPTYLASRGTDHATNGIRLGIDGWIYIAVGDFGFHNAEGRDGKKITMLGGGIVRVRPDGTEMEIYTHGTRNLYDVAIDPYMNIFTRDNTNDGGGWNIRFSHMIQTGEYGYPVLFKHFTEEIIPALVDLGGGSGTGALFMDDASWPAKYNHVPMMADWGRNELYIHRLTPDNGSYTQQQEDFIHLPQITDVDVDASGRMYLSAWDGAGYSGDSTKGFTVRVVPKEWTYKPYPDLKKASVSELISLMKSGSNVGRMYAQQELLTRGNDAKEAVLKLAMDKGAPVYARVAGMYGYAQMAGEDAVQNLVKLSKEENMKAYALRALTDRKGFLKNVPIEPFLEGLKDTSKSVEFASIISLGRLGRPEAAQALLTIPVPPSFVAPERGTEGPHATPNSAIIPPHLAVRALVALHAVDACVAAIGTENNTLALWALQYMHDPKAVSGLMAAYRNSQEEELKSKILATLGRLYNEEAPYDGTWWWSTRPDSHGPYYKPVTWAGSDSIKNFLMDVWKKSNPAQKEFFADLNGKLRMGITQFGGNMEEVVAKEEAPKVDLNKIRNKKGQIGESSIEDIMLAMDHIKGNPANGRKLFIQQGCNTCHALDKGEVMKGPFMGQIGSIMTRKQIAESILKPNASISQGFSTVQVETKDGKKVLGFVTDESAGKFTLRDITGAVHHIDVKNIKERKELKYSMMPTGMANALSYEDFASLITFLSQQKK
ncbi:heme-binding protein [Hanamia caeni]|uniref:Heme-binding protein n=1 Tax=Hanamia caeni TaxID=2294116 RepID=A0A3M9NM87_9BACT|nr:c-type cytochrome [Hanamia caeni]RNI38910.1 heme-binding protein [Hanamia caeni]